MHHPPGNTVYLDERLDPELLAQANALGAAGAREIHGFVMFAATPDEQRQCADAVNRWLAEGRLRANIDRILPLSQAAEAHRLQEANTLHKTGALKGKIVLTPGS